MTIQLSVAVRNARLDAIETAIGTAPILRIRDGSQPANCAAADSGTVLAEMTLPSDWMNAAASGAKTKLGTWQDASANASGTAGHWRLYESTGTTCHAQGSCTASGGGGDMELDDVTPSSGQAVTVTLWTLTSGNA